MTAIAPTTAASAIKTHSDIAGTPSPGSAGATGSTGADEPLLPPAGSLSFAVPLAELEMEPVVAMTFAWIVTVALPPLASVPIEQTTGSTALHVPCDGVALTSCRPLGRSSVTTTPVADDGPPFVTVIV